MKIKDSSWTIVILGNWNKYILSPAWTAKNIFEEPQLKLEFALNLGLPPRYTSQKSNIMLIPSDYMITFVALEPTDEYLQAMEDMAYKLVDILSYTPITAFGINFGFIEEASSKDLYKLFELSDITPLSDFGSDLKNTSIRRQLTVDQRILNLTTSWSEGGISFEFNFHYNVKDSDELKNKIKGNVIQSKNIAENLLKTVYKLDELEE